MIDTSFLKSKSAVELENTSFVVVPFTFSVEKLNSKVDTVTVQTAVVPLEMCVAVITAVPFLCAVTFPLLSTDATVGSELDQKIALFTV